MENYCDYEPTPERIAASKKLDDERKERCKLINERYGIYEESTEKREETEAKDPGGRDIKAGNQVLPDRRKQTKEQKPKKGISGHKINNTSPDKDKNQASLF